MKDETLKKKKGQRREGGLWQKGGKGGYLEIKGRGEEGGVVGGKADWVKSRTPH